MKTLGWMLHHANLQYFNFYDLLLLATFFQCLVFSLMFIVYKHKKVHHIWFVLFMLSISLGQLNFYITYSLPAHITLKDEFSLSFFSFTTFVFFIQGPLLYEYVRSLTREVFHFNFYLLIPVVVFLFFVLWSPVSRYGGFFVDIFWRDYVLIGTVGFLTSAVFGGFAIAHAYRYEKALEHSFSNIETRYFVWIKTVSIVFFVLWLLEIFPPFFYDSTPWLIQQIIVHNKTVATFAVVSYVIFSTLSYSANVLVIPQEKYGDSPESSGDESQDENIEKVKQAMEEYGYYRKGNLNIETFSGYIDLPVREVSNIINRQYGVNFYEFVNQYRIEAVKKMLLDDEWKSSSIQIIYEAAGFRSKSSFNTLFKKMEGMTPTEYRKQSQVVFDTAAEETEIESGKVSSVEGANN